MASRVLLVEGNDDRHVLYALLKAHDVPDNFNVESMDGVDRLIDSMAVRLKARNEERLGLLLDADENLDARWRALRDRVEAVYPGALPDTPAAGGTIAKLRRGFTIGIWLMPDNRLPGILEDFVSFLVPTSDALYPRVERFIAALPEDLRRFPPPKISKARLHAWLAVQAEPGKPLGQALTARYLDAHVDEASALIAWLRALFVD